MTLTKVITDRNDYEHCVEIEFTAVRNRTGGFDVQIESIEDSSGHSYKFDDLLLGDQLAIQNRCEEYAIDNLNQWEGRV